MSQIERRAFLGSLAGVVAVGAVASTSAPLPVDDYVRIGRLKIGDHLAPYVTGVTVDGVPQPVHRCIAGNDRKGWLIKFVEYQETDGRLSLRADPKAPWRLHREIIRGDVRFTFDLNKGRAS